MKIFLSNTSNGEVYCCSIHDAEIKSFTCTENVSVKMIGDEGVLLFSFDPNRENFTSALNRTRKKISEQKKVFLSHS